MANFFLTGAVTVVVTGEEAPLFPGRLNERGASLTHLQYDKKNVIRFRLSLQDLGLLRKEARQFSGTIRLEKGTGLPFLIKQAAQNYPFFVTSLCFFIVLIVLSAMIIRIEVTGADADLENQIRSFLKKEGIREGAVRFSNLNEQDISQRAVMQIPGLTRFSIKRNGVIYQIDVSAETKKKETLLGNRHLIASKAGVIHDLFVERGISKVMRGEFVERGDRLVTGTKKKRASGTVIAETWYKATAFLTDDSLKTRTGDKKRNVFISLGEKEYKVWSAPFFRQPFQKEENNYSFYFFSYRLPVSFRTEAIYKLKQIQLMETKDDQEKRAVQAARAALMAKLPERAVITGENVLQKRVENGKVKVIIHFQVLENIATN